MNNEIIEQPAPDDANPFRQMQVAAQGVNAGSVEIESQRAIAEAQGQLVLAKRFPRNMASAISEFMDSCKSPEFAKTAFYTVKNRGSGPSIRFAEECARCFGNFEYGHREIGRSVGASEIEVYAWDKQANNRSIRPITVKHVLDTQDGARVLKQQADIDNRIANVASKQMRGRILALMPKHMVAMGIEMAKKTLAGSGELPLSQRALKMAEAFKTGYGVNVAHIEAYIGHKLDDITMDEFVDLTGVYNALREGAKAADYFNLAETRTENAGADLNKKIAAGPPAPSTASTPAPSPAQSPAPAPRRAAPKPAPQPDEPPPPPPPAPPAANGPEPDTEDVF